MVNYLKHKVIGKENLRIFIRQFLKFGLVGVSNTAINFVIYYALLSIGINYLIASAVGFIASVLNAYYFNRKYVFHMLKGKISRSLIKTYLSYASTFLLSMILMFIMVQYLSVSKIVAPIINLLITIPLNFLLNKFWAFR